MKADPTLPTAQGRARALLNDLGRPPHQLEPIRLYLLSGTGLGPSLLDPCALRSSPRCRP